MQRLPNKEHFATPALPEPQAANNRASVTKPRSVHCASVTKPPRRQSLGNAGFAPRQSLSHKPRKVRSASVTKPRRVCAASVTKPRNVRSASITKPACCQSRTRNCLASAGCERQKICQNPNSSLQLTSLNSQNAPPQLRGPPNEAPSPTSLFSKHPAFPSLFYQGLRLASRGFESEIRQLYLQHQEGSTPSNFFLGQGAESNNSPHAPLAKSGQRLPLYGHRLHSGKGQRRQLRWPKKEKPAASASHLQGGNCSRKDR